MKKGFILIFQINSELKSTRPMNKILFSAVTKKFVMALAGLFLLLFLPVHLGINLLLLKNDPEPFNKAALFMATFPLVKVIEIFLFLTILVHICLRDIPADTELAFKAGKICCQKQIKNLGILKVCVLDRRIRADLSGHTFLQFLFHEDWAG